MNSKLKQIFAAVAMSMAIGTSGSVLAQDAGQPVVAPVADEKSPYADTDLMWAAQRGETEAVKALLAVGAKVDDKDNHGQTALLRAVHKQSVDVVKVLLDNGASTEVKDDFYGNTPLMQAAWYGNLDIVKALLDKGAKIDAVNGFNSTALLIAVEAKKEDVVKELLARGADVAIKGDVCGAPLACAKDKGYKDIESLLKKPKS